jgi:methylated-DNA-protein-cysteine methyltransferase-like protein
MTELTERIIEQIRGVPAGKVASYGRIAELAGNKNAARQVVRVLHTYSRQLDLPWQRILGSDGSIRLKPGGGLEVQASLLAEEGVEFSISRNGRSVKIDMERFGV